MSLTQVSYSMISSAPFSVLDYGAVGDGIANDAPAVQLAINAVAALGRGTVVFPSGKTYFLNAQINFCDNLTIMGYGAKIVAGRSYAAINTPLFKNFANSTLNVPGIILASENITVLGLTFDGADTGVPGGLVPNVDMHGVILCFGGWTAGSGVNGVVVRDCTFTNFEGAPVFAYRSQNLDISDNYFENIFANATLSIGASIDCHEVDGAIISGNRIDHTSTGKSWHGIVVLDWDTGSKNVNVTNNVIRNLNGGDGISCEGNSPSAVNLDNCVIADNVISDCAGDGIGVDHCIEVIVSNNTIRNVGQNGILAAATNTLIIDGNNLRGMSMSGVWANGIGLRAVITNNRIQDTGYLDANYQGEGIFLYNATGGNAVSAEIIGNYIKDTDACGIYCNMTHSVIQGNFINNFGRDNTATRDFGILGNGMVCDNIVIAIATHSSYGINIEDGCSVKNNRVSGTFADGFYRVGFRNAIYSGSFISPNNLNYDDDTKKIVYWGSATPAATGTVWQVGDIIYNTAPTAGGSIGWVCTTDGNPGTWKTWGAITA